MYSIFRKMQQFKDCRHSLKFPRTYLFIYLNSFVLLTPDTILQFIFSATDIRAVAGNWWNTRTRGTQGRLRWQQIFSVWIIIKLSAAPVFAVYLLCVCSPPAHYTWQWRDDNSVQCSLIICPASLTCRGALGWFTSSLLAEIDTSFHPEQASGFRTEISSSKYFRSIWYNIFWIGFFCNIFVIFAPYLDGGQRQRQRPGDARLIYHLVISRGRVTNMCPPPPGPHYHAAVGAAVAHCYF